jgi:hypothetical protein
MSETPVKVNDYNWHHPSYISATHDGPQGLDRVSQAQVTPGDQTRPLLRTYKSFPYPHGPSSRYQHDASKGDPGRPLGTDNIDRVIAQGPQSVGSAELPPVTYSGSEPTSPAGRLTPRSGGVTQVDEQLDDDELDVAMDEDEEADEKRPMTVAELRAHKRKMKRFRCAC